MGDPFEASLGRWAYVLLILYGLAVVSFVAGLIWP
jgi:hypothetical protein